MSNSEINLELYFPEAFSLTKAEHEALPEHKDVPAEVPVATPLQTAVSRDTDNWMVNALCRGPQREYFFPPSSFERKEDKLARERRAKEFCARCIVKSECLESAVAHGEIHGVWGGLNDVERKRLRTKRA